ncbi:MAG: hypothetical protein HWE13_03375 [Gammaproteobacteria bacterium]|nr:hypothetical protein [Gammaproteobacteria bacterium]
MMYQQVPALFYSLKPRFDKTESVRITQSQYEQLRDLVNDYCYSHDAPRLKGLIKRVQRRIEQHADHHLWHTEFDYISDHLIGAMKEDGFCRMEDDINSVVSVLNRNNERASARSSGRSRENDNMLFSQSVKNIFDKWLHPRSTS